MVDHLYSISEGWSFLQGNLGSATASAEWMKYSSEEDERGLIPVSEQVVLGKNNLHQVSPQVGTYVGSEISTLGLFLLI